MNEEIWKSVGGYEGLYEVSSFGQIRRIGSGKTLKDYANKGGYRITTLYNKNRTPRGKTHYVHHLVALAFIGDNSCCHACGNKFEVNHKDRNRGNNHRDNLEYLTHTANVEYSLKTNNE